MKEYRDWIGNPPENFLEELQKYIEETPRDKMLEDWAKTVEFDSIGPTIEEAFLSDLETY